MSREEVRAAKSVCSACPVRRECLKAALSGEEEWGVWGGFTAPERHRAVTLFGSRAAVMAAYDTGALGRAVVVRV
jgi:hypothetical protein